MTTKDKIIKALETKKEQVKESGNITYTLRTASRRDLNNEQDETKKALMQEETKKCNNLHDMFQVIGGVLDEKLTNQRTHERDLWCKEQGYTSRAKISVYRYESMTLTVFQRAYNRTVELGFEDLVKPEVRLNVDALVI